LRECRTVDTTPGLKEMAANALNWKIWNGLYVRCLSENCGIIMTAAVSEEIWSDII